MTVQIKHHLIDKTPTPTFGRIVAFDDGVLGAVIMLRGVFATRLVAATHMAATATNAKVKPFPAEFQTILAAFRAGRNRLDRIEMGTKFGRHRSSHRILCPACPLTGQISVNS